MNNYIRIIEHIQPKMWMYNAEERLGQSLHPNMAYLKIVNNKEFTLEFPNVNDYINPIGEIYNFDNGDQFIGKLDQQGFCHGEGTYFWKNRNVYKGSWVHGIKEGNGFFWDVNSPEVYCYMGEFKDNCCWGRGKLHYKNGHICEGKFVRNQLIFGTIRYIDGSVYYGNLTANGYHGKGSLTDSKGNCYKGHWKYGLKHGEGIEYLNDGSIIKGNWESDRLLSGTWEFVNGDIYIGNYKDYQFDGEGCYHWHTGEKYDGEWKDGMMNGKGIMWNKEGKQTKGVWGNNVLQYVSVH